MIIHVGENQINLNATALGFAIFVTSAVGFVTSWLYPDLNWVNYAPRMLFIFIAAVSAPYMLIGVDTLRAYHYYTAEQIQSYVLKANQLAAETNEIRAADDNGDNGHNGFAADDGATVDRVINVGGVGGNGQIILTQKAEPYQQAWTLAIVRLLRHAYRVGDIDSKSLLGVAVERYEHWVDITDVLKATNPPIVFKRNGQKTKLLVDPIDAILQIQTGQIKLPYPKRGAPNVYENL